MSAAVVEAGPQRPLRLDQVSARWREVLADEGATTASAFDVDVADVAFDAPKV